MARMQKPPGYLVRLHPDLYVDIEFARLTIDTRYVWLESLFRLAELGDPHGIYPHADLVALVGSDSGPIAAALLDFGLWTDCGLGYQVHEYCGTRIVPETRSAIPDRVRQMVYRRDGHRCVTCGSGDRLSLDHIHPWSLGGSDDPSNLQTMCVSCNSRKGARV